MMWLGGYLLAGLMTAVLLAYGMRGSAPADPDPVGMGLIAGLFWPLTWAIWTAAGIVESGVWLLKKVRP